MWRSCVFNVIGRELIHCAQCEGRIGNALKRLAGVREVRADHLRQTIEIEFDDAQASEEDCQHRLSELGYKVAVR